MAWRFPSWGRDQQPETPPSDKPSNELTDDFDLNALLLDTPPPAPRVSERPLYVEDDPVGTPNSLSAKPHDYLKVNHAQMRRDRERREAQQSFWARLRRGDLSTKDLPGQRSASNLLFRIGEATLAPFQAMFENVTVLFTAALAVAGVVLFGMLLLRFVQSQFGILM